MERPLFASGANAPDLGGPDAAVLRLLSSVHHPPARVWLSEVSPSVARALDARGYRVHGPAAAAGEGGDPFAGAEAFDLVCSVVPWRGIGRERRADWVAGVARALRPGGQWFGAVALAGPGAGEAGAHPSELIHLAGPAFEVVRLDPSAFAWAGPLGPVALLEVVFTRR